MGRELVILNIANGEKRCVDSDDRTVKLLKTEIVTGTLLSVERKHSEPLKLCSACGELGVFEYT